MINNFKHIVCYPFLLTALLILSVSHAQVNEYAPLSDTEKLMVRVLNQKFTENGYTAPPVSKKLMAVARWNVWDLQQSYPFGTGCGLFSWSALKPDKWATFCQNDTSGWSAWYNKPDEISQYEGRVSAILWVLSGTEKDKINKVSEYLFNPEKNMKPENIVTYAVATEGNFIALWLGYDNDPSGYHDTNDRLSNLSGLWYDPAKNGAGFHALTLPNNTTVFSYYGRTQSGENLWLISGSAQLVANQSVTVPMYEALNGTFSQPSSNTVEWGSFTITLHSCMKGVGQLNGNDGTLHFDNLQLLGRPDQVTCY